MPKKKMLVEWDDGADLSQSRKKPGALSPLTRDGDNKLGHVTLSEVDDDEEDWESDRDWEEAAEARRAEQEAQAELVALVVLALIAGTQKAAPHVKRWWNDQAVPFMRRSRSRLPRARLPRRRAAADESFVEISVDEYFMLPHPAQTQPSADVTNALAEYRAQMSSAEARERFVAALVARAFSEEQLRMLRDARIDDDGAALDLASAIESLTPHQLGESITLMLEANPSWPDDETLSELERIIERRARGDASYVPVQVKPSQSKLDGPPDEGSFDPAHP